MHRSRICNWWCLLWLILLFIARMYVLRDPQCLSLLTSVIKRVLEQNQSTLFCMFFIFWKERGKLFSILRVQQLQICLSLMASYSGISVGVNSCQVADDSNPVWGFQGSEKKKHFAVTFICTLFLHGLPSEYQPYLDSSKTSLYYTVFPPSGIIGKFQMMILSETWEI